MRNKELRLWAAALVTLIGLAACEGTSGTGNSTESQSSLPEASCDLTIEAEAGTVTVTAEAELSEISDDPNAFTAEFVFDNDEPKLGDQIDGNGMKRFVFEASKTYDTSGTYVTVVNIMLNGTQIGSCSDKYEVEVG